MIKVRCEFDLKEKKKLKKEMNKKKKTLGSF